MQTALKREKQEIAVRPTAKRAVKMQGNVAYINSDYVRQTAKPATVARPAVKMAVKTAAKPRTGIVSTLLILLIAFGALAVLVSRFAMVCSIGAQNNALKKNIQTVEAQMEALKLDMELRDDLQYVQNAAQEELGMNYPRPEQKIVVDMSG